MVAKTLLRMYINVITFPNYSSEYILRIEFANRNIYLASQLPIMFYINASSAFQLLTGLLDTEHYTAVFPDIVLK
jgi:hypothetical protein